MTSIKSLLCSHQLRENVAGNIRKNRRLIQSSKGFRCAAVAVTIVDFKGEGALSGLVCANGDDAAVVLTRRSGGLKNHAGQWAFPGGSIDPGEQPEEAALRELSEEVGLQLDSSKILGCLDDFVTRSGFHIVPVVVWGGHVKELQRNVEEVSSIHRIPCAELFRPDAPILEDNPATKRTVLYMPIGDTWIATPTAAILFQFKEMALQGKMTRVSDYDQPYFAWR